MTIAECPTSPVIPFQSDLSCDGNSISVPYRPEESYDTFESFQPSMFSDLPTVDTGLPESMDPYQKDCLEGDHYFLVSFVRTSVCIIPKKTYQ